MICDLCILSADARRISNFEAMTMPRFLPALFQRKTFWTSVALFFCLCVSAHAQGTPDDETVVKVESNLVRLNVGVADLKGRPIIDLTRNDFAVYENGVPQTILDFAPTQAPFSLVLLLDTSGSTLNFRTTLKQSALRFIDALGPEDRVAVISFHVQRKKGRVEDKIETLTSFTTDRKKIAFAIENASGAGETNFYKALRFSLNELTKEGQRRKAIVVLTDGLDTETSAQDRIATASAKTSDEAIAGIKPDASPSLNSVLNDADRQGVTIYPLALPSGDPKILLPFTPQQAAVYASARARLQTLALRTGGRIHEINRLEDMGRYYAEVAAEIRTLYTIAYQSSDKHARDGSWRPINIEVTRPQLIARTRPGYFAK